jgi:integrase
MRKGEVLGLRWEWVDLENGVARIPPTDHKTGRKTGKARVVHLCRAAVKILKALPHQDENPFVVVGDPGKALVQLQDPWERLREAAGLAVHGKPQDQDPGLHDLRRTFSSVGADMGFPELIIGALLGHSAGTVTQGYTRMGDDPLHQAAEKIGARVAALLNGTA